MNKTILHLILSIYLSFMISCVESEIHSVNESSSSSDNDNYGKVSSSSISTSKLCIPKMPLLHDSITTIIITVQRDSIEYAKEISVDSNYVNKVCIDSVKLSSGTNMISVKSLVKGKFISKANLFVDYGDQTITRKWDIENDTIGLGAYLSSTFPTDVPQQCLNENDKLIWEQSYSYMYKLNVTSDKYLKRSGEFTRGLAWDIFVDAHSALSRVAENEKEYGYYRNFAGSIYCAYLSMWIDGSYKRVSNTVYYFIGKE